MKDHLHALVRGLDPVVGRNVAREYLQARILWGLQRAGAMSPLAFQGGTALRFLYGLARYSEDLDFALEERRDDYDLRGWMRAVVRQLRREGYAVDGSVRDRGTMQTGWIRVRGLLHEVGLSPHRDEVLAVKLDVDTQAADGWAETETSLVRKHASLRLHHHDRGVPFWPASCTRCCAAHGRRGRDIHDLAWYLGDPTWPSPNLPMLNAALTRTGGGVDPLSSRTWRGAVAERVEALPWEAIVADVRPFLESGEEMATKAEVLGLLVR